jgi:uncharacterized protein
MDISSLEAAALRSPDTAADIFVQLGLIYSAGREVIADRVAAHKWFNLAALRGNGEAARLRRELAQEMTEDDIAEAQRAARRWLGR